MSFSNPLVSLRGQLLAIFALATLVPFTVLLLEVNSGLRAAERTVYTNAGAAAASAADDLDQDLGRIDAMGRALAAMPGFTTGTDAERDQILAMLAATNGGFGYLRYFTPDFQPHGSSTPGQAASLASRPYAVEAVQTGRRAVAEEPVQSRSNGMGVLPVVVPVGTDQAADGQPQGFLLASMQTSRLNTYWDDIVLPPGSKIMLLDTRTGKGLGTSLPDEADLRLGPLLEEVRTGRRATRITDQAGQEHLVAWHAVAGTPWVVVVSTPSDVVLGPVYASAAKDLALAVGATLVTALLLLAVWRRLMGRLGRLSDAAARWGDAEWSHRVEMRGSDELATLGQTFDRMAQQTEALVRGERLRALGELAGGVAHDLNQSLTLVASYSDLARQALEQSPPDLAEMRQMFEVVSRAALDGGDIVKRLLTFARSPAEGGAEQVDVNTLLSEVAQLTAPRWRAGSKPGQVRHQLMVDCAPGLAVEGWPANLREALTNLIFNAVDALPHGGTIRLAARAIDDHVQIEVADDGTGMPPEVQARIFEPFFTTKGERGNGLGLAQVSSIVERHHGHIRVISAPGQGTTFQLTFPRATAVSVSVQPAAAGEAATRAAEDHAAHRPSTGRPLRVLAVDDEPLILSAVERVLRRLGHTTVLAPSGEEAVAHLAQAEFDVVVSDLGMGSGMDGWELADHVRRRWPGVRFVLASGWGAGIDPGEARARGVDAVIGKPYRPADLARAIAGDDPAVAA